MNQEIKILLIKKNMNMAQLAELLGTSRQNLYAKVSRKDMNISFLKEVSDILDVELEIKFRIKETDEEVIYKYNK